MEELIVNGVNHGYWIDDDYYKKSWTPHKSLFVNNYDFLQIEAWEYIRDRAKNINLIDMLTPLHYYLDRDTAIRLGKGFILPNRKSNPFNVFSAKRIRIETSKWNKKAWNENSR